MDSKFKSSLEDDFFIIQRLYNAVLAMAENENFKRIFQYTVIVETCFTKNITN